MLQQFKRQAFVGLSIVLLLLLTYAKFRHFWIVANYAFPDTSTSSAIIGYEYGTARIGQHHGLSSSQVGLRHNFPPLPALPRNESFGACLIVKGDNDLLAEWIAYHYTVLPLRYVLVASDVGNPENPTRVLKRWTAANTGLQWWAVDVNSSVAFQDNRYGEFSEKEAERYYKNKRRGSRLQTMQTNNSTTNNNTVAVGVDVDVGDPKLLQYIAHSRLVHRQRELIGYCTNFMKNRGVHWVSMYDTDEFLAINRMGMEEEESKPNNSTNILSMNNTPNSPNTTDKTVPFDEIYGIRPNLPPIESNATVVDIIQLFRALNRPLKSCHTMPRVSFGAGHNFTCPGSEPVKEFARANNFDLASLSTLRFQQHAAKEDYSKNRLGKVFVDVSNISESTLSMQPKNVHRPYKDECMRPFPVVKQSPFYLMHYAGGWERFKSKEDKRRGFEQWKELADVNDSTSCCRQENHRWLPRFADRVGLDRAKYLLGENKNDKEP
mmetsp:Transcript_24752/g.54332  ORF Transcript_24752/g.54332 Transcript_24752/m.54332 type:complete len:492 (-) Transcript_24752:51-1526(-)